MKKTIELKDKDNTIFTVSAVNDTCGEDRYNVSIQMVSDLFGGYMHCVMKNVRNEHTATTIFNNINETNVYLAYELMN